MRNIEVKIIINYRKFIDLQGILINNKGNKLKHLFIFKKQWKYL